MNIIISNQNYRITDSLNVEIIKTLQGEFSLDDITKELVNFYYNKIIIDITAIQNHYDINSVIRFLRGFEPSKIVILLNDSQVVNSPNFLSKLVENGYYNFTRNAAGITYLIDNPNDYEDVKQYETTKTTNDFVSYTAPNNFFNQEEVTVKETTRNRPKIIGVQNLTEHAGSTTLVYMMQKQLKYNYSVKSIEMNKQDFIYFRNSDLSMCTSIDDLKLKINQYSDVDVILIDLNGFDANEIYDDILYLVDPGTLKLNKLLKKDYNIVSKTKNGKIILNRSSIKLEEISNLEYETKFKVFFNITNFDDRKDRIQIIDSLLYNLGFDKQNPNNMGFFSNIFHKN